MTEELADPRGYWRVENDSLVQGGVEFGADKLGREVLFHVAFRYGALAVVLESLTGAAVKSANAPGDMMMATRMIVYSDPPGPVSWTVSGKSGP